MEVAKVIPHAEGCRMLCLRQELLQPIGIFGARNFGCWKPGLKPVLMFLYGSQIDKKGCDGQYIRQLFY